MRQISGGFLAKLPEGGYKKYLLSAAAAGLLLISLSGLLGQGGGEAAPSPEQTLTISQYCAAEEARLGKILSHIEGVGEAHVMVTLENGVEYRYAADEKQSGDSVFTYSEGGEGPTKVQETANTEQSYILVGSSGDRRPLVLTELSPRVKGVVVVCEGGESPIIRQRVTEAVTTAMGISSLQVCVTQASK